jgi:hypothetical protein
MYLNALARPFPCRCHLSTLIDGLMAAQSLFAEPLAPRVGEKFSKRTRQVILVILPCGTSYDVMC